MATCVIDNINHVNVEKIESFLNDSTYKEALESSASFNTRLSIERRMRLPFLDSQTGVAQNHSQLFLSKRQRMPGLVPGQIYSYPRPRWRKKRRQYLLNTRPFGRFETMDDDIHSISQMENPILQDGDSKDSQMLKDEVAPKEWYYDEADMLDMDPYDEPDQDSDLDYEESYSKKAKKRKGTGRGRGSGGAGVDSPGTPGRRKGGGRGRKRATMHNYEPTPGDPDKPFACELCGARYKTRPGLTYHYGHSHKEGASDENSREATTPLGGGGSGGGSGSGMPLQQPQPPSSAAGAPNAAGGSASAGPSSPAGGGGSAQHAGQASPSSNPGAGSDGEASLSAASSSGNNVYQDSYVSFLNHPAGTPGRRGRQPNSAVGGAPSQQAPPTLPPNLPVAAPPQSDDPQMPVLVPEKIDAPAIAVPSVVVPPMQLAPVLPLGEKPKAAPSPYCDFCLGDAAENKKTAEPEELVSCSDCGRSGHPSCLQFTANMKISVKKYRWQCIECKCCSVCGTSDNDDQLLFCDDCDRGYHMYCLSPPLNAPPEGSWSCKLCIDEFHKH